MRVEYTVYVKNGVVGKGLGFGFNEWKERIHNPVIGLGKPVASSLRSLYVTDEESAVSELRSPTSGLVGLLSSGYEVTT